MRNLTIRRNKSFVASLAKMKVYISDPTSGELEIGGIRCRKLGELKNGEEKTFSVDTAAAKIFVIADTISCNYSNDCYPLPAGTEDVVLTGKNVYSLAAGNPFRFDGVTDETILANRKKGSRKGMLIIIPALLLGILVGLLPTLLNRSAARDFSANGMTITLTDAFEEADITESSVRYQSNQAMVWVLRENFTLLEGLEDYTLEDYGRIVMDGSGLTDTELQTENGLTWFCSATENPENGKTYHNYSYIYKTDDAFWLVQFVTVGDLIDKYAPQFEKWAQSVTFA